MRGYNICCLVSRYTWTADDQRDVDIGIVRATFARLQSMLSDMEAIIGSINYKCIVEDTIVVECGDKFTYHIIKTC